MTPQPSLAVDYELVGGQHSLTQWAEFSGIDLFRGSALSAISEGGTTQRAATSQASD